MKQAYLSAMTASATKRHNSLSHHLETRVVEDTLSEGSAHKDFLGHSKEMKEEAGDQTSM